MSSHLDDGDIKNPDPDIPMGYDVRTGQDPRSSGREKGQRRESLSMLADVAKFLTSDRVDADSTAVVHDAVQTMYLRVAPHVESDEEEIPRGGHDEIDDDPPRGETPEEMWGGPDTGPGT